MKKTLTLFSAIILFSSVQAQSFDIGARYFAVSNWFFNSNISNAGGSDNYSASYSYSYGVNLAYNFNEHISIETNVLLATLTQSYNGQFSNSGFLPDGPPYIANESFKSTTKLYVTQIPLFFRFLSGNGAYAEIGPEFDMVTDAGYSSTYTNGPTPSQSYGATQYFPKSYMSGVLAFGNNIRLHNSLYLNINLKFSYDFTDLVGMDGFGQSLAKTNSDGSQNPVYAGSNPYYPSYKATHAVSGAFAVGLTYRFGHDF